MLQAKFVGEQTYQPISVKDLQSSASEAGTSRLSLQAVCDPGRSKPLPAGSHVNPKVQYVPPDVINRFEVPAPAAPSVIRSAADLVRGAPAAAGDHAAGLPSVPPVPLTPDVAQRSGSSSSGGIDGNLNPSTPHMTYAQLAGLFQLSNQQTNQLSQVMAEENQRTNQQFGQCFRAITHVSGRVDNLEDRFERYAYTNGSRVAKLERQVRALTPQKKTKKRK